MNKTDNRIQLEKLKKLIGLHNYDIVRQSFAGQHVYFPKNDSIAKKHQRIRTEYQQGASFAALAAKYGYTSSHIRSIVKNIQAGKQKQSGFFRLCNIRKLTKLTNSGRNP